ncbi:Gfo/Idh/MocA family oxidoreductase [bacterium]|nr:MAG: Gfo/Idh/MocA family oxidoreductase [bacterium]
MADPMPPPNPMPTPPFRIGIMGCGTVADYGHSPAIHAVPELALTAVFDPVPGRAEDFARRHAVPAWFEDQEAFFAHGLDAVVICSPAPFHHSNVLAAAAHGVHVLCEKPIAMDDEQAEEMKTAMASAGKGFAVAFVYRYAKIAGQIRDWVQSGVIGDVRSMRLVYCWHLHGRYKPLSDGEWVENDIWRGRMLEGGPMVDCGVHQIDLARWWSGREIVRSTASAAWVADGYEAPDHVYAHLDHEGGLHTMVEMSFSYGHTAKEPAPIFTYDIIGTGGVIRYDRNGWSITAREGEGVIVGPGSAEKGFVEMHQAFAKALETNDWSLLPTPQDGQVATHIARTLTEFSMANRPT